MHRSTKAATQTLALIWGLAQIGGCTDRERTRGEDLTPNAIVRSSYFSDTQDLNLTVPRPLVVDSPSWDRDAPNPPFAARDAIDAANNSISTLDDLADKRQWQFDNACLFRLTVSDMPRIERWFWIVAYHDANAVELQRMAQLEVAVLMNGRVITPTLFPAQNDDEIQY